MYTPRNLGTSTAIRLYEPSKKTAPEDRLGAVEDRIAGLSEMIVDGNNRGRRSVRTEFVDRQVSSVRRGVIYPRVQHFENGGWVAYTRRDQQLQRDRGYRRPGSRPPCTSSAG